MSCHVGAESFDGAAGHTLYLSRSVRDESDAAASAYSLPATLINVASETALAERCRPADDRAWIAANRLW